MKIGIIFGAFDLLHAGHVLALKEAKVYCDWLVVGLQLDPSYNRKNKNKPIQSIYERYQQLVACRYVDRVIPYETEEELTTILAHGRFDIRFLGADYLNGIKTITSKDLVEVKYLTGFHNYSSTELRERIKNG